MFELIAIIIFAAFFARLGKESKVPGFVWAIISIVCWIIGSLCLVIIGGFVSQIILFLAITIGRCMFGKDLTGGPPKSGPDDGVTTQSIAANMLARNVTQAPAPEPVLPPQPDEKWWVGKSSKEQLGPVDMETLKGWISSGQVSHDDLVYTKRLTKWQPASKVTELSEAFAARQS
jgi:hypothetical protein